MEGSQQMSDTLYGDCPAQADLCLPQGQTLSQSFRYKQDDAVVNLSGYIGRAMFRDTVDSATVALSLTTANGGVVISAAGGLVTLSASAASMSAITAGRYVYDVEIESASGIVKRLIEGVAKVSREVTR
jgi:hypothetical protein